MNGLFPSWTDSTWRFKYEVCDYSCSEKGGINHHIASAHGGNKPYKCEVCDYRFSRKGDKSCQNNQKLRKKETSTHMWICSMIAI